MQESLEKVYIIGMGGDGKESLGLKALHVIERAEILFGAERLLSFFLESSAQKIMIKTNLSDIVRAILSNLGTKRMVVLTSGDPLFYGIANYLMKKIAKEHLEIIPNISSMQLAFARAKENWEDAILTSVHAKPIESILEAVERSKKIGILTDNTNTPSSIADLLLKNIGNAFHAYVCENLGSKHERVTKAELTDLIHMTFSPLNILILIKKDDEAAPFKPKKYWTIGIPDEEFFQRTSKKGLISKLEIRVVSLSKMHIGPRSIIWDVGAGSGSVSIEAALIAKSGIIYTIERNEKDILNIKKNVEKFGLKNVKIVHGLAPDCLGWIENGPDAVFIGGSLGNIEGIIKKCHKVLKPGGKIVINAVTLETLHIAYSFMKKLGFDCNATLVQASRSKNIQGLTRFEALNPVFILDGEKKDG